jgi:hypothetical protein
MRTARSSMKVKGKVKTITCREGKDEKQMHHCTLFINLGAKWGWVVNATSQPLYPWE